MKLAEIVRTLGILDTEHGRSADEGRQVRTSGARPHTLNQDEPPAHLRRSREPLAPRAVHYQFPESATGTLSRRVRGSSP
jgi:hypothetical protein